MVTSILNARKITTSPTNAKATFVLWLVILVGWIANIVQTAVDLTSVGRLADISAYVILQGIGIIWPFFGAVLGYVGLFF